MVTTPGSYREDFLRFVGLVHVVKADVIKRAESQQFGVVGRPCR
jgi:hypothetical protein